MSGYDSKLVTTEENKIQLFVMNLNSKLQILSVHMTAEEKSFNQVTYFGKTVEGVRKVKQATALAKRPKSADSF